ncbi:MAG: DNA-3-methyladenine glycosylase I [Clostridiales bacterium]|nr:DNA-3-methyladenine glycosylase I [Clostridiales bacterium]
MSDIKRCSWCNEKNPLYVKYHDEEWCVLNLDEHYLFEMLVLESFQAGLSWECVLNKRKAFRKAYDNFDLKKVMSYGNDKINELTENRDIIRNRRKIEASIKNANVFYGIENEFGSFADYLTTFTKGKILSENGKTTNELSDRVSADLKSRGMSFVGSTIVYSYLQAVGIIKSHDKGCFMYSE